jgi:Asp-tRNA(Asn)/Glu-tRNA(Gln) amidotransferase A subunit family amidase
MNPLTDMKAPEHTLLTRYPNLDKATTSAASFTFSIKDLFDVAGEVTTAGSKVLADSAPAKQDAVAVARLKAAGGLAIGRTNMSEFAFSGVGWNPHYGTPVNPATERIDPRTDRIPGGSSSGAAVSVACEMADMGLGSDTGGSLRIPAALCGLVGFKSTARLVPTGGALPLSTTLDTVGAITRDVNTAIKAHEILSARTVAPNDKPLSAYRVSVIKNIFLDDCDETVARAFQRSLKILSNLGLQITEVELPELAEIPSMNATGGFSPIEAYRWHKGLIAIKGTDYDPRVAQRILLGAKATESDYQNLIQNRANWIARVIKELKGFDAVLSPTVPIVAPAIADIATDDAEFFRINGLLLRNPSIVNFLDGCAISIPCQRADEFPVGLMLWQSAMHDDTILNLALCCEKALHKAAS